MSTLKTLVGAVAFTLSTGAMALPVEGVFRITERTDCVSEHNIDSVIVMADAAGGIKAFLSSAEYGIIYQVQALTIADDGTVEGSSTPASHRAATLEGTLSEDGVILTGTVDSIACPTTWTFSAERQALPALDDLEPVDQVPQLTDFVGTYAATTDRLEGTLRFMRLRDDTVVGSFINEYGMLIDFYGPRLNVDARTLELFSPGEGGEARLKWHLGYGKLDGAMALQGYAISATGRVYPVSAKKQ